MESLNSKIEEVLDSVGITIQEKLMETNSGYYYDYFKLIVALFHDLYLPLTWSKSKSQCRVLTLWGGAIEAQTRGVTHLTSHLQNTPLIIYILAFQATMSAEAQNGQAHRAEVDFDMNGIKEKMEILDQGIVWLF